VALERKARDAIYNNGVVIATASFSEVTATRRRWPKIGHDLEKNKRRRQQRARSHTVANFRSRDE